MKYIFSLLFIVFINLNAFSQRHGVYVGSGIDFTYAGKLITYQAGLELNRHRIGFIYEERFDKFENKYSPSYNLKGGQYVYTVYREKHLNLGIMFRAGISDNKFVAIIPALTVGIIFNDYIKVNMVGGVRGEMPAIGFNLFLNMPFKSSKQKTHEHKL